MIKWEKKNKYIYEKIHRKETVMKKVYEKPNAEEMLILSESVMTASGEEDTEEEIVDNELNDNTVSIFSLLNR